MEGLTLDGLAKLFAWFVAVGDFPSAELCAEVILSIHDEGREAA